MSGVGGSYRRTTDPVEEQVTLTLASGHHHHHHHTLLQGRVNTDERASTQLCGSWPCRGSLQNSNLLAIVVKRGGACTLSSTTCPLYAPGYMFVTELADSISSTMA